MTHVNRLMLLLRVLMTGIKHQSNKVENWLSKCRSRIVSITFVE